MSFKYEYKTEEELELSYKHLTPGEAKFMVRKVTTKDDRGFELVTSSGHAMMKLELVAVSSSNERGLVTDIISANAAWKLKELVTSLGVPQFYGPQASFEPEMLIGLQGKVILYDREFEKRDGTKGISTSVKNYLPGPVLPQEKLTELAQGLANRTEAARLVPPPATDPFSDDIPF